MLASAACPAGVHVFLKSEPLRSGACYSATVTPTNATLDIGKSLNVTVDLAFIGNKRWSGDIPDGTEVYLDLVPGTGNGTITQLSPNPVEIVTKRGSTPGGRLSNEIAYTLNARAWFVITPNAPGPFSVQVSSSLEKGLLTTMDITGVPAVPIVPTVPAVAKLLLHPHKAYRRCGDPIALYATALYANHTPVAGVNVTLAVYGDCAPDYVPFKLTDSNGRVRWICCPISQGLWQLWLLSTVSTVSLLSRSRPMLSFSRSMDMLTGVSGSTLETGGMGTPTGASMWRKNPSECV